MSIEYDPGEMSFDDVFGDMLATPSSGQTVSNGGSLLGDGELHVPRPRHSLKRAISSIEDIADRPLDRRNAKVTILSATGLAMVNRKRSIKTAEQANAEGERIAAQVRAFDKKQKHTTVKLKQTEDPTLTNATAEPATTQAQTAIDHDMSSQQDWLDRLANTPNPNGIFCTNCHTFVMPGYVTLPNVNDLFIPPPAFLCHQHDEHDFLAMAKSATKLLRDCVVRCTEQHTALRAAGDHDQQQQFTYYLTRELRPALDAIRDVVDSLLASCYADAPQIRDAVLAGLLAR